MGALTANFGRAKRSVSRMQRRMPIPSDAASHAVRLTVNSFLNAFRYCCMESLLILKACRQARFICTAKIPRATAETVTVSVVGAAAIAMVLPAKTAKDEY